MEKKGLKTRSVAKNICPFLFKDLRYHIPALFIFLILGTIFAPPAWAGWSSQVSSTGIDLTDVDFPVDATTGYAVGGQGGFLRFYAILKTTDGGATWVTQDLGLFARLHSVHFPVDATTGYAVGTVGFLSTSSWVIKTTDGGATWVTQTSGVSEELHSVHFPVDATTGYAVGTNGTILKTTDGGTSWVPQVSGTTEDLNSVHFPVDATTGYAVGTNGTVLKTTDGGATWVTLTSGVFPDLNGVHFPVVDATGYLVGANGTILKTTDGGATGVAQTSGTTEDLNSVHFPVVDATGYAVGTNGTILKTTDGGATWVTQTSGVSEELNRVHFPVDATTGYAVGTNGTILKTTDGGRNSQTGGKDVPPEIEDLTATSGNGEITINWTPAPSSYTVPPTDYHGVLVVRREGFTPDGPSNFTAYIGGDCYDTAGAIVACTGSTLNVVVGKVESANPAETSSTISMTDTGLTNGVTYEYWAFAFLCQGISPCADVDERYVVIGTSSLTAIPTDRASPNPLWTYNSVTATLAAPSLIPDVDLSLSTVFYSNNNGRTFGIRGSDGMERFRPHIVLDSVQSRSPVGTLSGDTDATLFVGSLNGDAYAIWASGGASGTQRWSSESIDGDDTTAADQPLGDDIQAAVIVSPGANRAFIATRNLSGTENRVFAVSADTGTCQWVFNGDCTGATGTVQLGQISQAPIHNPVASQLYLTSTLLGTGSTLWSIDTKDTATCSGRLCWSRDLGDVDASPSYGSNFNILYVGTNAGEVYKLYSADGTTCWADITDGCGSSFGTEEHFCTATDARTTACSGGSPVKIAFVTIFSGTYVDNVVFSTADGNVRMIDPDGIQIWKTAVSGASLPLVLPDLGSGKVYVGGNDGLLRQLDLATGTIEATRGVGGGSVIVGDSAYDNLGGQLYVPTSEGKIHAFTVPF